MQYRGIRETDIRLLLHSGVACLRATLLLAVVAVTGCATPVSHKPVATPAAHPPAEPSAEPGPVQAAPVLDLTSTSDLEGIIPALADKRVVLIGEIHDRYDHHLVQLEIIRRLHAINPRLAIGMEAFQQPFQQVLDEYVAGNLSEQELLRGTGYYQRWRFDYRLYAPILRYAREHRLPVIALNLPTELTRKVGRSGLDALDEEERARLPAEIDRSDTEYEQRLRKVYERHPGEGKQGFANFLEVQLLWDEGMAERAADYLREHPETTLVVLAGRGHLARGSGIPNRLDRRLDTDSVIILNGWEAPMEPGLADYVVLPEKRNLPAAGRLGALLEEGNDMLRIEHCLSDSPCMHAGLKPGDQVLTINDATIKGMADLRLQVWDKQPGDTVTLVIRRKRWFRQPQELVFEIELR
jgi:uncharacterized iron-regulated protein